MDGYNAALTARKELAPYFWPNGKLAMRKACWLNRDKIAYLEETFDSISNTRVRLLQTWTETQWDFLQDAMFYLATKPVQEQPSVLAQLLQRNNDFSELFIVDANGMISASSFPAHTGHSHRQKDALAQGSNQQFLHGPYIDKQTLAPGPSSSSFHDEVTLMFYQR